MEDKTYVSIPYIAGTDGDAAVAFINATFREVNDLKKRYPDPDFGAWLMNEIYFKNKILTERRGFFKKRLLCPACNTELSIQSQASKQMEYELKYKNFTPFIIQITIPSVECSQCKKICGIDPDGSLSYHLNEAIIHAFKSENIKP
jgi:hypothetical protein